MSLLSQNAQFYQTLRFEYRPNLKYYCFSHAGGYQTRSRAVLKKASTGGEPCPPSLWETRPCHSAICLTFQWTIHNSRAVCRRSDGLVTVGEFSCIPISLLQIFYSSSNFMMKKRFRARHNPVLYISIMHSLFLPWAISALLWKGNYTVPQNKFIHNLKNILNLSLKKKKDWKFRQERAPPFFIFPAFSRFLYYQPLSFSFNWKWKHVAFNENPISFQQVVILTRIWSCPTRVRRFIDLTTDENPVAAVS